MLLPDIIFDNVPPNGKLTSVTLTFSSA